MLKITELGYLKEDDITAFKGKSYAALMAHKLGCEAAAVKATAAQKLGLAEDDAIVGRMEWLGLFDAEKLVEAPTRLFLCLRLASRGCGGGVKPLMQARCKPFLR